MCSSDLNALAALTTGTVALVVVVSRFTEGAYLPAFVIAVLVWLFRSINKHYRSLAQTLRVTPAEATAISVNHTVVVRNELLGSHPDVARTLMRAFTEAKARYLAQLVAAPAANAEDMFFRRVGEVIGDPLPYGIEPNRRMIQAVIDQALEQGILTRPTTVDALFPIDLPVS